MTSRLPTRALLATTAAGTALLLSSTPALAATTASKGTGSSTLQVLTVTAGGHSVQLGGLSLLADTVAGTKVAKVTVTPLVVDGTKVGEQVITPAESPLTVPAASTPGALSALLSLTSPAFTATATEAPATTAGADSLGAVELLGFEVPLNGELSLGSSVTSALSSAQKSVTVQDLALPSIADILASLGLDVSKLPVGTLTDLVGELGLVTDAITTALDAVDTAQAAVDAASAPVTAAAAALATATSNLTAAQADLTAATSALDALVDTIATAVPALSTVDTIAEFEALDSVSQGLVTTAIPTFGAAYTDYTDAQAAVTAAQTAVTTAQGVLDAAQAAIQPLVDALNAALAVVDDLALPVLADTPLVSLDSLSLTSKAVTSSNVAGGQTAEITGGEIAGLHVLGTDVLDLALGSSSVEVLDLVGDAADEVTALIGDLTGTLESVLSSVPGVALEIPAPQIDLLAKTTTTSISDGYGRALASVQGLSITLPSITLPVALALPNAVDLPALQGVTQTAQTLTSAPINLGLATLSDQSAFTPSVTTVPGNNPGANPPLAATGAPVGVAALAVLLLGGGLVLRRRRAEV